MIYASQGWFRIALVACFAWILFVQHAAAQKLRGLAKIDSLQRAEKNLTGTAHVDVLNAIAFEWFGIDDARANTYAEAAFAKSEKLDYTKGKCEAQLYRGLYARFSGDVKGAVSLLKIAISLARELKNKQLEGYALTQLATALKTTGNQDSAFLLFNQSYKILQDSLYPLQLSSLYKNWGLAMGRNLQHRQARIYLFRSLAIRQALQEPVLLIDIYLSLSEQFTLESRLAEANQYIKIADSLSRQLDVSSRMTYEVNYQRAVLLMKESKFKEAFELFNEVKLFYKEKKSKQEYVHLLSEIGLALIDLGNYELGMSHYFEALPLAQMGGMQRENAKLSWQIAEVHYILKQFREAKAYCIGSLKLAESNNYLVEEATVYNLLGLIAHDEGQLDSALAYFDKSLKLREDINDKVRIASTLGNIGFTLRMQGKPKQAIEYVTRANDFMISQNNLEGQAWTNEFLGRLYIDVGNLTMAQRYLDLAEQQAREVKAMPILQNIFQAKAEYFEKKADVNKSLMFYKMYVSLHDSIYSATLTDRLVNLQNQFQVLQKDKQIELLNREREWKERELEINKSRLQLQRVVIFSGVAALVLALVAAYAFYRNYKNALRLHRDIQEKNEEIQAQSEELQASNQMITEINQTLEHTVEERTSELKQAYKELDTFFYRSSHDFRRPLTTFMGLAEVAKIAVKDEQALHLFEKVNETARSLDKMLVKLQSVSDVGATNLIHKEIFFSDIFELACNSLQAEICQRNVRVSVAIQTSERFFSYPALLKIITENLLENAITFSDAESTISLRAFDEGGVVYLEVKDSGIGIDPEYQQKVFEMYFRGHERSKGNGLGLYIVKRMVEKLNGKIILNSAPGRGTTVRVGFSLFAGENR